MSQQELLCLEKIHESIGNVSRINEESITEITTLLHNIITDYYKGQLGITQHFFTESAAEAYRHYITRYNYAKYSLRQGVLFCMSIPIFVVGIPIACTCKLVSKFIGY
jgi:hypothetical protein